jgi:hypothetical protein
METTMELPPRLRLSVENNPSWEDRELIGDGLGAYNAPFLRDPSYAYFRIFVRGDAGAIRAGLIGRMAVRQLAMGAFGCHSAWLDTFSFEAPEFYRKLGYREFARLDYPPDHQRIFLKKQLIAE